MSSGTSLYRHLLGWMLLPLLVTCALLLLQSWFGAQRGADRAYDRLLASAAQVMSDHVSWRDNRLWFDLPASALTMLAPHGNERVFYALVDREGHTISGNADLASLLHPTQQTGEFEVRSASWQGIPIRVGALGAQLTGWKNHAPYHLLVAHTPEARRAMALQLFRDSSLRLAGIVALAVTALLVVMRQALAPLRRLRQRLRERTAHDLSPLEVSVPRELQELLNALNALLERQRQAHIHQQRFVGDASHQLRTPLAGISASAELALRSDNSQCWRAALQQLQGSAQQASRLAEQLLSLTRLDSPEAPQSQTPVALDQLAGDAVLRFLSDADIRGVDLGLVEDCPILTVTGSAWQLEEALGNLIDNALRHARSEVTVGVRTHPPALYVKDDGPGVPEAQQANVLRPFYRAHEDGQGSGLGLAIADSVARTHGGQIHMQNLSDGFMISLSLHVQREEDS